MASRTRRFFLNGISLTLTALIMRGVGMIFNVYVSNRAGSEAMGLYSLLGSIYAFSVTLGTAGINLGTTRLVSDALGTGDEALAKRSAGRALIYSIITGIVASVLLYFSAPILGKNILGDTRAIKPLRILALTLIPVALCSCLSGYFTAVRRVKVNAAFQIATQFIKIVATVYLLSIMVDRGTEAACVSLVLGGAAAEFFSLAVTYALYRFDRKKLLRNRESHADTVEHDKDCSPSISKKLLGITLPVTFSGCVRSALSMLQHVLIPKGIFKSGKSWAEALSSYGALHGMAMPLILFPSAFITAFAGLLVPEVSECCVQGDGERLRRTAYRTLSLSLIFSVGVSGIMLFFSKELGTLIYHSEETALYIRVMAPLIPVMYIDSATDAILKGSGHQVYSMNVNIIDALTSCIFALTLIPVLGIWGYVISIYATEILNTTLSLIKMFSVSEMRPKVFHQVVMPIVCIIGATNASKIILSLIHHPFGAAVELILHILLTVTLYAVLLLFTKTLGNDEGEFLYASLMSEKAYDKKFRQNTL